MENMLMIAAIAANDWNVWTCAHCESCNFGDTKLCVVCDHAKWSVCSIMCECTPTTQVATNRVNVELDPNNHPILFGLDEVVQVPLPYMTFNEVPGNYAELMDMEREGALQLTFHF